MVRVLPNTPGGVDRGIADRYGTAMHDYETINLTPSTTIMPKLKSKPRPSSANANALSDLGARIVHYLQAGYPGLYLVSPEEQRVEAELKSVTDRLNQNRREGEHYQLCYWSVVDGLVNTRLGRSTPPTIHWKSCNSSANNPSGRFSCSRIITCSCKTRTPSSSGSSRTCCWRKTKQKPLIIVGCRLVLPPELEREITVVEFALPGKAALGHVLEGIVESAGIKDLSPERRPGH